MEQGSRDRRGRVKQNLFEAELQILRSSQSFLEQENINLKDCKDQLALVNDHYEDLLDQSKLITKVSDRLQKKITKAHDALEETNIELQETLDALTKAKVGRKAAIIVLGVFVILFVVSEALLEPLIEDYARGHFKGVWAIQAFNLGSKGLLALLFRPVESLVEKILMKRAQREQEAIHASRHSNSL